MTTPEVELVLDLPQFWETRVWNEAEGAHLVTLVQEWVPAASRATIPLLSAAAAVPVFDEDGVLVTVVLSLLGVYVLSTEDAVTFGSRPIRRRRRGNLADAHFELDEFAYTGPPASDGRVPLLAFATPNLDFGDTLGEAFAHIASTARWVDGA